MTQNCVSEVVANRNRIPRLAFQLWDNAGRPESPEGRDFEFWLGTETYLLTPLSAETVKMETVEAQRSSEKRVLASPLPKHTTPGAAR